MNQLPTISSLLSTGWAVFKKNWKFIISAALITALIAVLLQLLKSFSDGHLGSAIVTTIASIVFSIAVTLGWATVLLKLVRNNTAQWSDFKTKLNQWKGYVIALIVFNIYKIITMLLVLPLMISLIKANGVSNIGTMIPVIIAAVIGVILMIWVSVKYTFIAFVAADDMSLSGGEVLKRSSEITKGNMWRIFGYSIVFGLVNLVGFICIIIGLLITIPTTKLAMVKLYDSLKEKNAE